MELISSAVGKLKNFLFSDNESDLLTSFRNGKDIRQIIQKSVWIKLQMRGGLSTPEQFENPEEHTENRSIIRIGG